ncbi:MAG: hypothetical protein RTU30_13075 [Candidatus Thorarchaeota archaeon]
MVGSNVKYGIAGMSTIIIVIVGVIVIPPLLVNLPGPSDETKIFSIEERILNRVENHPVRTPWLAFLFHYYERYKMGYEYDEYDTTLKPIFDEVGPKSTINYTTGTIPEWTVELDETTVFDILDDCLENFNEYKEYYRPVIPPEFFDMRINDTYDPLELSRAANLSAITQVLFQLDRQQSLSTSLISSNPPVPISTPWGKIRIDGNDSSPYIHSIKYQNRDFDWVTTSIFPDANTDLEGEPSASALSTAPSMSPGRVIELHGANFYDPSAEIIIYYWSVPNSRWAFHSMATPYIVGDQTAPLDEDWDNVEDVMYFWLPENLENTEVAIGIQNDDPRMNPFTRDIVEGISTDAFALIEISGHRNERYQFAGRALQCVKQSEAGPDEIMAFGMADYNLDDDEQKVIKFFNIAKEMEVKEISPNQVEATILHPLPSIHRWILHKPDSWINPDGPVLVTFQIVDEDGGGAAEGLINELVSAILSAILGAIGLGWLGGLLDLLGVFDALFDLFSDPPDLLGDDRIVFMEDELYYLTSGDDLQIDLEDSPHFFTGRQTFDGLINTVIEKPGTNGELPGPPDYNYPDGSIFSEGTEWQFSKDVRWYEGSSLVHGTAYGFAERRYYHHVSEKSTYLLLFDVMRKPAGFSPVGG